MFDFLEGEVLLVDKPLKWTSFDVVNKLKFLLKRELGFKKIKIGHAGTLDPLATGLLLVCTGKKTKTIPEIQEQKKTYTGIFEIGAQTASYDLESPIEKTVSIAHIQEKELYQASLKLTGEMDQMPPIFSAKKINGKRAYELARKGEQPIMNSKKVMIYNFELTEINLPEVHFKIECSKGTYIRSMAHDFGQIVGVGAYLKSLRRTKIGEYNIDNASSVEKLQATIEKLSLKEDV